MPDLPLDERALVAVLGAMTREPKPLNGWVRLISEDRVGGVISAYLREAAFEIETEDRRIEFGNDPQNHVQRLVGPWLPIQEEEKE